MLIQTYLSLYQSDLAEEDEQNRFVEQEQRGECHVANNLEFGPEPRSAAASDENQQ